MFRLLCSMVVSAQPVTPSFGNTVGQAGLRLSGRWPDRAMHWKQHTLVFEIAHLYGSVMPVAMDKLC